MQRLPLFSRFLSAASPNLGYMTPEIPADLLHSPTFQAERIRKCLRDGSEEVLAAAGDVTTVQAMLRRLADQLVFGV